MIYEEPKFYPGGDRCIEVEFGDDPRDGLAPGEL
jgi:hypothetical protein